MLTEKERGTLALGWILLVIGFILLVFGFGSENWIHQQAVNSALTLGDYQFWLNMDNIRQFCIPLSIVFIICGGVILFYQMIMPKNKENSSNIQSLKIKDNIPMFTAEDESINILRTRYAKGEITKEQYEQMKKDLEK